MKSVSLSSPRHLSGTIKPGMLDKLVKMQVQIVQQEALITQSHRQLHSFIAPFDPDVKILSWDKVIR